MPDVIPQRPAATGLSGTEAGGLADALALTPSAELLGIEERELSPARLALRRFLRHKLAMASLTVLVLIALACILAPLLVSHSYAQARGFRYRLIAPGAKGGLFGTDPIGRDQFSRVLYGGRVSLAVGLGVALSATVLGTVIGAVSGYFGGRADNVLMRITDLFLAMPLLVILILASKALGGKILDIVFILSAFFWMPVARIVRGLFLSLKEKEFVEAARSMGAGPIRIMFRHLLPNCMGPIIVNATLSVAGAILTESVLSFLGFGIQPPVPTWGNLLDSGRRFTTIAPWLVWFPGLAILLTVLAVNFLGDGLRDALDPTQRRVRA
jgi:peptide/nickel transport system permease protein